MPNDSVELNQLLTLRSALTVALAQISAARTITDGLDRATAMRNPAPEILMLKTRGGRRKIARIRNGQIAALERNTDQVRAASLMLALASTKSEEADEVAKAASPGVRKVLRRKSTIDAVSDGASSNKSRQAYAAKLLTFTPLTASGALADRVDQGWAALDLASVHVVRRLVSGLMVWGEACPVRAPLAWGLDELPQELDALTDALDAKEIKLCRELSQASALAGPAARAWAQHGRLVWETVVPYARALDKWADARGPKRRLIPQQFALSLRVAEVARAGLRAYAAGNLCDLSLSGDGPAGEDWCEAAGAAPISNLAHIALAPLQSAEQAFSAATVGQTVRVTGAVNSIRTIQVNRGKRIHVLILSSPGSPRSMAVLPYFNPIPLGIQVGTVVQLSGKFQADALDEFVNRNTSKALSALEQELGTRQGIGVARFDLDKEAKINKWAGWVATRVRPAFDVAPSSISGLWSLHPGLHHVVARKTWFTEDRPDWRRELVLPEGR